MAARNLRNFAPMRDRPQPFESTRTLQEPFRASSYVRSFSMLLTMLLAAGCDGKLPPASASQRELGVGSVIGAFRTYATQFDQLRAGSDALQVTPEPPIFVPERGSIPAEQRLPCERLDGSEKPKLPVQSAELLPSSRVSGWESESSSDDDVPHPSRGVLERRGVTSEERRAIRQWSFNSSSFRSLSTALAQHPELATMSYAEAEARGWLRNIDLGHSGIAGFTRDRELNELRLHLRVDLPALIAKMPKVPGTVYRGLHDVPVEQIAIWRQNLRAEQPIELGLNGGPGYASATERMRVAQSSTRSRMHNPNRVSVLLEIKNHGGVSMRELSLGRSAGEILIPQGAHFLITSVEESPRGKFKIQLLGL
jgi:hypothetical protein